MQDVKDLSVMAMGVALSMWYHRRTGWPCGGLMSPGLMALQGNPLSMLLLLGSSVLVFLPLRCLALRFGLYGREKVGTALLLALFLKGVVSAMALRFPHLTPQALIHPGWAGFVVPGIVAAEADSHGLLPVMAGTAAVGAATAFAAVLLWG